MLGRGETRRGRPGSIPAITRVSLDVVRVWGHRRDARATLRQSDALVDGVRLGHGVEVRGAGGEGSEKFEV